MTDFISTEVNCLSLTHFHCLHLCHNIICFISFQRGRVKTQVIEIITCLWLCFCTTLSACNSTDEPPTFQAKLALHLEECQENRSVLSAVSIATPFHFPCHLPKIVLSCKKVLRVKMTAAEIFLSLYWEALFLLVPIFLSLICGFGKMQDLARSSDF